MTSRGSTKHSWNCSGEMQERNPQPTQLSLQVQAMRKRTSRIVAEETDSSKLVTCEAFTLHILKVYPNRWVS